MSDTTDSPVATPTSAPVTGETATSAEADATIPVRPNPRKVREGLIVSNSMTNTVVVAVIERVRHPRYAKTVQRTKRFYADDPSNELRVGDRVRLQETRPISKLKRWRVIEVLERAK
jgi:small subunit ribosomal protein S17